MQPDSNKHTYLDWRRMFSSRASILWVRGFRFAALLRTACVVVGGPRGVYSYFLNGTANLHKHDELSVGFQIIPDVQELLLPHRISYIDHCLLSVTARLLSGLRTGRFNTKDVSPEDVRLQHVVGGNLSEALPNNSMLIARLSTPREVASARPAIGYGNGTASLELMGRHSEEPRRRQVMEIQEMTKTKLFSSQLSSTIKNSSKQFGLASPLASRARRSNLSALDYAARPTVRSRNRTVLHVSPVSHETQLASNRSQPVPTSFNSTGWLHSLNDAKARLLQVAHASTAISVCEGLTIILVGVILSSVLAGFVYNITEFILHETIWRAPPPRTADDDVAAAAAFVNERQLSDRQRSDRQRK